ncbi:MAG: O-phosphoseryl-tRNA(Sec) selenium transferase [Promethearchaeota archaeon]
MGKNGNLGNDLIKKLENFGIPSNMLNRAMIGRNSLWQPIFQLLDQRRIPDVGWSDWQIRELISLFNSLDSDKDPAAIRIGEREGRVSTPLLTELSGNFLHGIGRSGDLTAPQPKAAGASLMQNLTNRVVLSLIKDIELPNVKGALTLPFSTGMTIALSIRGILNYYSEEIDFHKKHRIIMTQVDHKSPQKGIKFIGGTLEIIPGHFGENYFAKEGVYTSIQEIEEILLKHPDEICAIVSSSAFFAPRVPDDLKSIAKLAKKYNIIHIINNSYGVQSPKLMKLIRQAIDAGRVDAIVQSTDKCFLTPVGGAIITSPNKDLIQAISKAYAGRASASPVLHLLVSLLSMGKQGYFTRIHQQQESRLVLEEEMNKIAEKFDEHIIQSQNPVSCAMTLSNLPKNDLTRLGGLLYNLRVTGPRVVQLPEKPFGSCTNPNEYSTPYIVMNAAIGVKKEHILKAVQRLEVALQQLFK